MSRHDFTRAVFRSALARANGRVHFGGPDDDAERPPHESDVWITTDDAWDYAEWLDRRASKLGYYAQDHIVDAPSPSEALVAWSGSFFPWHHGWKAYHAELEHGALGKDVPDDITWARVNSWDKIKEKHRQLLELQAELDALAAEEGLPEPPPVPGLPYELPDRAGDGVKKVAGEIGSNLQTVAIIAAIVGGIYLLKTVK